MATPPNPPYETPILKIAPFESDPRVLVLTYAADWKRADGLFLKAVMTFRDRCKSGEAPLPAGMIGAIFDARASGMKICVEDQFSGLVGLWAVFTRQCIPLVIDGPSEKDVSLMEMMRVPFLLADSLEEAAGICKVIGPAMRNKDAGTFERIWVEHRKAFYSRNGRTPPERREELPSARKRGQALRVDISRTLS